ncbi:UPF0561 protein C2orf68 homolog isoform X1 [Rhea pennata]|uniref:UPF0561 protein C2orf68 homolog isoform X1 n=1 Tax=Rhea pennata TaxID=8795 RepID=UPI002E273D09
MEAGAGWRCRPGGRLDMSHGFVRHIRRNQIARDAYERAVRQARGRARKRHTPAPPRPRRPDQQVYRPRGPEGVAPSPGESSAGATAADARGPRLFCLEYEGDDGSITAVIVHQEAKAKVAPLLPGAHHGSENSGNGTAPEDGGSRICLDVPPRPAPGASPLPPPGRRNPPGPVLVPREASPLPPAHTPHPPPPQRHPRPLGPAWKCGCPRTPTKPRDTGLTSPDAWAPSAPSISETWVCPQH